MIKKLKFLLFPLSIILYIVLKIRHFLYDKGYKKYKEYNFPVICVGNLALGGTGKTPMSEYIISFLKDKYKLALLSRGYKRTTKGFLLANENTTADDIGDEPYQIFYKNKDIVVAVSENRVLGVNNLIKLFKKDFIVLLDDALQHRKIKAGYNILLSDYKNIFCDDFLFPVGSLRDLKQRANFIQSIIITKCPEDLNYQDALKIKNKLLKYCKNVYFTKILYSQNVKNLKEEINFDTFIKNEFTLVTGIANPQHLISYIKQKKHEFKHIKFSDHHKFSQEELKELSKEKIILTTEKDFVRLKNNLNNIFYIPIKTEFIFEDDKKEFENDILNFCNSFNINQSI